MEEIVRRFIKGEHHLYSNLINSKSLLKEFHIEIQRQVKEKETKYYYYLITFTLKPSIKKTEYEKIEKFILSQVTRPALKIKEAHYIKEYTKKNIPHWHISIKSKKFIAKNRFNYYQKHYGNIDISKSTNKSLTESLNYINKVQQSIQLLPRVL